MKNKIPGITDEQLNWLMSENGSDINREKAAATALQTQLDNAIMGRFVLRFFEMPKSQIRKNPMNFTLLT